MGSKLSRTTLVAGILATTLLFGGALSGCSIGGAVAQPTNTPPAANPQPAISQLATVPAGGVTAEAPAAEPGRGVAVPESRAVPPAPAMVAPAVGAVAPSYVPPVTGSAPMVDKGIAVTGVGQVSARPDKAVVSAGVQTRALTAQEAQASASQTMQAVIDAIKALGIAERDIQTSGVSLYPVIEESNVVSGYTASNTVTVTVQDVSQAGAVLDAVVKAGANVAGGVTFGFQEEEGLRNQALAAAAVDARSKAEALAGALGLKISGVESVSEGAVDVPRPFYGPQPLAAESAPAVPIEPGEQTVTAQVTVVFGY